MITTYPAALAALILPLAMGCALEEMPDGPAQCVGNESVLQGQNLNAWNNGIPLDGGAFIQGVQVDETLLQRIADGASFEGEGLIGVTVTGREVMLSAATVDSGAGALPRHLRVTLPDGSNVCGAGGEGLLVAGVWNVDTGDRHDAIQIGGQVLRHTFSCAHGVIAKCVTWGYDPIQHGADIHQTCTRLARADYCGNGVAHTENGTSIDVFDPFGILEPEGGMEFEAGWGPDGAVCVNHPRYLDVVGGDPIFPSCWSSLPHCEDSLTAEEHGALLMNASTMQERIRCSAREVPHAQ